MSTLVTTFPRRSDFQKAAACLNAAGLSYRVISPEAGFARVATPALIVESRDQAALWQGNDEPFTSSGWVHYVPAKIDVPREPPKEYEQDVFGQAAVMVLAPCIADPSRIRMIAHISGNLTDVFPYWNTEMHEACYNPNGPTLGFMDGHRMVAVHARRVAVAKADEVVDAWRVLEWIRCQANDIWARRDRITPCYQMRAKPPALEIFKRLPRTNCGRCGEKTCLAFAVNLWLGQTRLARCQPVFSGDRGQMKHALMEVCAGLGVLGDGPVLQ